MKEKSMITSLKSSPENFNGINYVKNKIHIKILLAFSISIALSIIILSIISYFYFERVIIDRIYKSESNNLIQAGVSTELMQELSKSMAIQMYNDFSISGLLFIPHEEPVDVYNALTSFNKYRNLIPYIHSIYIYNPKNKAFYINSPARTGMIQERDTFFDAEIINLLEQPENINSVYPIPRIIDEPGLIQNYTEQFGVYTFIYNLSGVRSPDYPGTIIINISESWVRNIIDSLDINPLIKTLIIDKDDRLLISDSEREMLTDAGIYKYIEEILTDDSKSGYSVIDIEKEKYFLVYSIIDTFSWFFVKLIPFDNITAEISEIRKNLIILALIILLIGAATSFFMARRLYKPISNLLLKFQFLQEKSKSDTKLLNQFNFRRLLTQSNVLSKYELDRFIDELNIGLNEAYSLLLFEIDKYKIFKINYSRKEQQLIKLGIINSISGLLKEHYCNEGIDLGNNNLVFILSINHSQKDSYNIVTEKMIKNIQQVIKNEFEISLSTVICNPRDSKEDISSVFERAINLSHYKYLYGYNSIISESSIDLLKRNTFIYPYKKEEKLFSEINNGNKQTAVENYNEIISYAEEFGYNALITTRNSLAYSINKFINKLKKNNFIIFPFDFSAFFTELNCGETKEESNRLFYELINKIISFITERNSSKNYEFISSIIKKIDNDYSDISLGISHFADIYNLSAAYLGRLFKKYTGKTMPDYINELRINKAADYILSTKQSISEIMELCGFTNKTHFYSMFKKYNGATPRDFRQKAYNITKNN